MEFDAFASDKKTIAAVVQKVSVIGEAANQIPINTRQQAPEIDWRRIVDMRNRLIHGYYEIRLPILWDVVQNRLPSLIAAVRRLLNAPDGGLR